MKCPNCLESYHDSFKRVFLDSDNYSDWSVLHEICPTCHRIIVYLKNETANTSRLVWPKAVSRNPIPVDVDDAKVVSDYTEACLVLDDSPKASAALSRRSLQYILRSKAGVKDADLANEIQQVLDSNSLPSSLAENLDSIRAVGNFAAHPIKSKSSGEVVDVEPGEAEWNLEVLEDIIDFYYVKPAMAFKKRQAINQKLQDAGKPILKS